MANLCLMLVILGYTWAHILVKVCKTSSVTAPAIVQDADPTLRPSSNRYNPTMYKNALCFAVLSVAIVYFAVLFNIGEEVSKFATRVFKKPAGARCCTYYHNNWVFSQLSCT